MQYNFIIFNRGNILTGIAGLLKIGKLKYGYWLRSTDPDEQLVEVIQYFSLILAVIIGVIIAALVFAWDNATRIRT